MSLYENLGVKPMRTAEMVPEISSICFRPLQTAASITRDSDILDIVIKARVGTPRGFYYPDWKIFDPNIVQLLGNAGGADHIDKLGFVEVDLFKVGGGQVGSTDNLVHSAPKTEFIQLGFVFASVLGAVVSHIENPLSEISESVDHLWRARDGL